MSEQNEDRIFALAAHLAGCDGEDSTEMLSRSILDFLSKFDAEHGVHSGETGVEALAMKLWLRENGIVPRDEEEKADFEWWISQISEYVYGTSQRAFAEGVKRERTLANEINQCLQIIITNAGNIPASYNDAYPTEQAETRDCGEKIENAVQRAKKATYASGSLSPQSGWSEQREAEVRRLLDEDAMRKEWNKLETTNDFYPWYTEQLRAALQSAAKDETT